MLLGPFNCIRTERLLVDALAGDEEAKRKLRLLRLPHAISAQYRNAAVLKLAVLVSGLAPCKTQTLAKLIAAALDGRYGERCFLAFTATERENIAAQASEVVFWMDGTKRTLSYREIVRIIARGG
jgi:hypothetical protein